MNLYQVSAEEYFQINQALAAYARGIDRMDRDLALAPFAPEATLLYSGRFAGDAPGFMDWVFRYHDSLVLQYHHIGNVYVTRNTSGELVSEAYIHVTQRRKSDNEDVDNYAYGRYLDRWIKTDQGLQIIDRSYVVDVISTRPHTEATRSSLQSAITDKVIPWARDYSDGSYAVLR